MAAQLFDHVDLRVKDWSVSLPLYEALMASLGMQRVDEGGAWIEYARAPMTTPYFAITQDGAHQGNATRIAFAADTREEVDAVYRAVVRAGALHAEAPDFMYHPGYYGTFFEDADGNRFEVCCHTVPDA